MRDPKKLRKLLCRLMWLSSSSLMFPKTLGRKPERKCITKQGGGRTTSWIAYATHTGVGAQLQTRTQYLSPSLQKAHSHHDLSCRASWVLVSAWDLHPITFIPTELISAN